MNEATRPRTPRVLFVAGLDPVAEDGAAGGQLTAARMVLESDIVQYVDFIPLSSTMRSIPPPPLLVRAAGAAQRMVGFVRALMKADVALIFSSSGMGLIEKSLMCAAARLARRGVVLRVSSGAIPAQCASSWMMKWALKMALRSAHVICSQGEFWTGYFGGYREAAGKIVEIGNGVCLGAQSERRFGDARLLFVGWLQREKGVFELLEALKAVRAECPDATLTMAGGGRDLDEFRSKVDANGLSGAVRILGWVPAAEVRALLRESGIFVLPSHHEGLPNALLEAMSEGIPVVTTPVGSIPDAVQDGENGLLVDVGDAAALADRILGLVRDPERAEKLGAAARETISQRYDIRRVWPQYYDAIVRAGRAAGRLDALPAAMRVPDPDSFMNGG